VTEDKPGMTRSQLADKCDLPACSDIQPQDLPNEPDTELLLHCYFSVIAANDHSYTTSSECVQANRAT